MTWTGRQLDAMTLTDGTQISYACNSDGLRVSKTVGNDTVKYRWDGTTLLAEEHANYTITFLYDGDSLIGFTYGGNNYYGIHNLGVIHYIYNEAGAVVVTYTYDAWGNTIAATGNATLIDVNPIRYKSYYYDSERGLFYLQSRYYDPQVGRFVSADSQFNDPDSIIGTNLFTYCDNNCIIFIDSDGHAKTYVFYYNGTNSLKKFAVDSAYYNSKSKNVKMVEVNTSEEFIKQWNDMSGASVVYLYLHGDPGMLCFKNNKNMTFTGSNSFKELNKKTLKTIFLFSCHGGSGSEGSNVAYMFAKLTGAYVKATPCGVSFTKGLYWFGSYEARVGGSDFFKLSSGWGTYYYQKKYITWGSLVPKVSMSYRKWAV